MTVDFDTSAPYALAEGEGTQMAWFTAALILKASAPELGVCDVLIAPGEEPPLHVHSREDEWFYFLDGEVTCHVGDQSHLASAGAFVHFPRGIPHTFTVETPSARFLLLNTPGGFERMFERAPTTVDDAVRALNDYGVEVVGPHPRDGREER